MNLVINCDLTAAFLLKDAPDLEVQILEADPKYVGGISRTHEYKGYLFDIGGHRFFSKSAEINQLWQEMLPEGFIQTKRSSTWVKLGPRVVFFFPLESAGAPSEATLSLSAISGTACG